MAELVESVCLENKNTIGIAGSNPAVPLLYKQGCGFIV